MNKNITDNIKSIEQKLLDNKLTITKADKNGGLVILDTKTYAEKTVTSLLIITSLK